MAAGKPAQGLARSRRGVHALIVERIGRDIVAGAHPPGTVLPSEGEYSATLSVSRTSVREAIKTLAGKGLVESRPKIGTKVRARRAWNMLDPDITAWAFEQRADRAFARSFFELRAMIEPQAAALAAARRSVDDLERIREGLDGMQAAVDGAGWVAPDILFHQAILTATGNELLVSLGHLLEPAFSHSFAMTPEDSVLRHSTIALHRAVFQAIDRSDPEAARAAMETLLGEAQGRIVRQFAPDPSAPPPLA